MRLDQVPDPALSEERIRASSSISRRAFLQGVLALAGLELAAACKSSNLQPRPTPPAQAVSAGTSEHTAPVAPAVTAEAQDLVVIKKEYNRTTDRVGGTIATNSQVNRKDFDELFAIPSRFLAPAIKTQIETQFATLLGRRDNAKPTYLELKSVQVADVYRITETQGNFRPWVRERDQIIGKGKVLTGRITSDSTRDEGDIWLRKRDAGNNPASLALFLDKDGILKGEKDRSAVDPEALSRKVLIHTAASKDLVREGGKNIFGEVQVGSEKIKYKINNTGLVAIDVFN